MSNIDTAF